ncbi:MAG: methyl-accepting chemotaxis protein [Planctomycetota bacterium]
MGKALKRVKLGRALWGAFGLLLLLAIGQSGVVVKQIADVEQAGSNANDGVAALTAELSEVQAAATTSAEHVRDLASRVEEDLVKSMQEGQADMQILQRNVESAVSGAAEIVGQLEELLDNGDLDDDTAGLIEDLLFSAEDNADRIRKEALPLVRSSIDRLTRTAELSRQTSAEIGGFVETMNGFSETSRHASVEAEGVSDQINRSVVLASSARWATVAAAAITIALGILVPLILVPRTNNEVQRVVNTLEAVSEGDLSQRLDAEAFDEFARIGTALNKAVGAMEGAVVAIRSGSVRLASSSDSLSDTANSLTGGATRTTQLSVEVASAAEEMSANMSEIASAVEQVSGSNSEISTAAQRMLSNIGEVTQRVDTALAVANEATQLVESGEQKISRLGDAAGEISEVSQVIQDIADMTNLLALNATIEAARAGEAGKGFAVVATEVKDLANQTSEATDQIRRRIDSIRSASEEAVELVLKIDEVIRQVRDESGQIATTVSDQDATTNQIATRITEAATAAGVVATSVSQTAIASQEIAEAISAVDAAAKETAAAANETRDSGEVLTELSYELNDALSAFEPVASS